MSKEYLKAFSLERSFSNFLIRALLDNFKEYSEERVCRSPWKHMTDIPTDLESYSQRDDNDFAHALRDSEPHIVFPLKDPYKWLVSYFRGWSKSHLQVEHYETHDDDFLADYIDHMPPTANDREFVEALLKKYNRWFENMSGLYQNYPHSLHVTYDRMLSRPGKVMFNMRDYFGLTLDNDTVFVENKEVVAGQRVKRQQYDTSFWTSGEYWNLLEDWHIDMINEQINWDRVNQFGIERESQ